MSYTNLSNFNYTTIKIILENKFLPLGIDLGVFNFKYKDYKVIEAHSLLFDDPISSSVSFILNIIIKTDKGMVYLSQRFSLKELEEFVKDIAFLEFRILLMLKDLPCTAVTKLLYYK